MHVICSLTLHLTLHCSKADIAHLMRGTRKILTGMQSLPSALVQVHAVFGLHLYGGYLRLLSFPHFFCQ